MDYFEDWTETLDIIEAKNEESNFTICNYLQKKYLNEQLREKQLTYKLEVFIKPLEPVETIPDYSMEQSQRRVTFNLTQELYTKLKIDGTKCQLYKEVQANPDSQAKHRQTTSTKKIVLQLQKNQTVQSSNYEDYIRQVLEYIDGKRSKFEFNKRNQLDFIQLCDIFQLNELKQTLMSFLSQNFDKQNVFDFLRLAAQDSDNKDALRESYWIIIFIYLRKIGIDISDSFKQEKSKQMLQGVNSNDYTFVKGFLIHEPSQKKIELGVFEQIALEEAEAKDKFLEQNNMHNLTRVERLKGDQGLFSDYPHHYKLRMESKSDVRLFAERQSENSEFIVSQQQGEYTKHGRGYMGQIVPNFLGTKFDVYDYGFELQHQSKDLPKDFLPLKRRICQIEYDSNFFAEKPRSFRIGITDYEKGNDQLIYKRYENMAPKFNESRGCYTLNFYGRVNKASARNFQLVETDGDDDEDIMLSHGKCSTNEFNLDYRSPFNQLIAFCISLTAIGKKRVVG
eukprot:403347486